MPEISHLAGAWVKKWRKDHIFKKIVKKTSFVDPRRQKSILKGCYAFSS